MLSNQTDVFRPTCTFTCAALQLPTSTPLPVPTRGQHGLLLTSVSSSSLWNMSLFLLVSPSMWLSNSFSFSSLSSCSVRSQRWSLRSCLRVSRHPSSVVRTYWGQTEGEFVPDTVLSPPQRFCFHAGSCVRHFSVSSACSLPFPWSLVPIRTSADSYP